MQQPDEAAVLALHADNAERIARGYDHVRIQCLGIARTVRDETRQPRERVLELVFQAQLAHRRAQALRQFARDVRNGRAYGFPLA